MVHSIIVGSPCQVVFKVVGTNTREEHWAIKLPWLRPLKIVHPLIEVVACGHVDSINHASVGEQNLLSFFLTSLPLLTGHVKAGG